MEATIPIIGWCTFDDFEYPVHQLFRIAEKYRNSNAGLCHFSPAIAKIATNFKRSFLFIVTKFDTIYNKSRSKLVAVVKEGESLSRPPLCPVRRLVACPR